MQQPEISIHPLIGRLLSIGGQHKALGNQRSLPDGTGNAGNAPLL